MRALSAVAALAASPLLMASLACGRKDRVAPDQIRAQIQALEIARQSLRERMNELMVKDPRLPGMPHTPVRVGVPTTLARDLIAGATCGDLDVTQEVSGGVRPDTYPVSGGLELTATAKEILAEPRFPLVKIRLKVNPSAES